MAHNAAYKLSTEDLDVVLVEDSKSMQTVLRTILMPLRLQRVRVFDSADEALHAMVNEPPNLVITDWRMHPTSGYQLLKAIRQKDAEPLCYVPVIFVTAHATRPLVEKAIRGGAHHLLAKPVSPARLHECIHWVMNDARQLVVNPDGTVGISGVVESLDQRQEKRSQVSRARAVHRQMELRAEKLQGKVDELLEKTEVVPVKPAVPKRAAPSRPAMSRAIGGGGFAAIRRRGD